MIKFILNRFLFYVSNGCAVSKAWRMANIVAFNHKYNDSNLPEFLRRQA